jgi:hypothetical protein
MWIRYFNEPELSYPPNSGHCMRDLGRADDAVQHAENAMGDAAEFVRSDFFVSVVLADAHLAAGDIDRACPVTLHALTAGEQIRSAMSARRRATVWYFSSVMPGLPLWMKPSDWRARAGSLFAAKS